MTADLWRRSVTNHRMLPVFCISPSLADVISSRVKINSFLVKACSTPVVCSSLVSSGTSVWLDWMDLEGYIFHCLSFSLLEATAWSALANNSLVEVAILVKTSSGSWTGWVAGTRLDTSLNNRVPITRTAIRTRLAKKTLSRFKFKDILDQQQRGCSSSEWTNTRPMTFPRMGRLWL